MRYIYKDNLPAVRNYIKKNNGTEDDVKDIYQEAVVATWLNIKNARYTPKDSTAIGAYIFQVAKYKWLDRVKSKAFKSTVRFTDDNMDVADLIEVDSATLDDLSYIGDLYARMGDKCKSILGLFYYEKKSLDEIGALLGHDAASLRTMKYR